MNSVAFIAIAILTLAAALAAAALPKLIHAALSFALAFVGIAAFFFLLGAEFVGLVQVFVYIGAVAVLIVFTILLTRRDVGAQHVQRVHVLVVSPGVVLGDLHRVLFLFVTLLLELVLAFIGIARRNRRRRLFRCFRSTSSSPRWSG